MERYKIHQQLTYIPLNQLCRVAHNSLAPGGTNVSEAFVTVLLPNKLLVNVPVEVQDTYLTTRPPRPVLKNGFGIFPGRVPDAIEMPKHDPAT